VAQVDVAHHLAEQIWSGDAPAGSRLEPERRLAKRFGVSRPTVRAALRRLASEGLVRMVRGRQGGAVVLEDVVVPPALLPDADVGAVVDALLEVWQGLEPLVARLAAERWSAADLDLLRALVAEQRRSRDGWAADLQRDARFHLVIARSTHNAALEATVRRLQRDLYRARFELLRTPHATQPKPGIPKRTLATLRRREATRIKRDLSEYLAWLERLAAGTTAVPTTVDNDRPSLSRAQ